MLTRYAGDSSQGPAPLVVEGSEASSVIASSALLKLPLTACIWLGSVLLAGGRCECAAAQLFGREDCRPTRFVVAPSRRRERRNRWLAGRRFRLGLGPGQEGVISGFTLKACPRRAFYRVGKPIARAKPQFPVRLAIGCRQHTSRTRVQAFVRNSMTFRMRIGVIPAFMPCVCVIAPLCILRLAVVGNPGILRHLQAIFE